jgi:hypothetical protein
MDAHLAQGGARGSGEPIAKEIREPLERSLVGVLAEIEQQQVGRILFDTRASISLTAFSESPKIRFLSGIGFVSLLDFGLFLFDVCL